MEDLAALVLIAVSVVAMEMLWRRTLRNGARPKRKPRLAPEVDRTTDRNH